MKICTGCHIEKEDSCFRERVDNRKKTPCAYLNNTCRQCDIEIARSYYNSKKDDPAFKLKNAQRARDYAKKNCDEIRAYRKTKEYKKKHNDWELKRYHKQRDVINYKAKLRRQKAEYKKMMREYRKRNKDKIYKQETITKKRYHEKHRDEITDRYAISLLKNQGVKGITPEMIEIKKTKILIARIKNKVDSHKIGKKKICNTCGKEKDLSEFWKESKKSEKRVGYCRTCGSVKNKRQRNERHSQP